MPRPLIAVVSLELRDEMIELTVQDDGRGLPEQIGDDTVGIEGMRERALLVRGTLALIVDPGGRHDGHPACTGGAALMPVPLMTRILLADDHELVRGGLKMVLESQPDLKVVAEAGDGAEALEIALHRPRSTSPSSTSRCPVSPAFRSRVSSIAIDPSSVP